LDDQVGEAGGSGHDRVLGRERPLQRAEHADQEEIEKDEERDADAPQRTANVISIG
jgi:hypothetical protein